MPVSMDLIRPGEHRQPWQGVHVVGDCVATWKLLLPHDRCPYPTLRLACNKILARHFRRCNSNGVHHAAKGPALRANVRETSENRLTREASAIGDLMARCALANIEGLFAAKLAEPRLATMRCWRTRAFSARSWFNARRTSGREASERRWRP